MIRNNPFLVRLPAMTFTLLVISVCIRVEADDWPTHRHDIARTGISSDEIPVPLKETWVFQSKLPPQPAWLGPARRDGWHKTENLRPRAVFDWAFHVVGVDGSICFGSSADDKVYCLDSETGEEKWSFFTEAPIRLAPTIYDSKVYVGSDDGLVYCLSLADGSLIWKYRAAPAEKRIPGNNRLMSVWPIRSGVLVDQGVAYFTTGIFPQEGAYICAVNAEDGKEIWKKQIPHLTPQGYLLASAKRLYVPTGRGEPFVLSRDDGHYLYTVDGSGGTFCLLTGDVLIYGPGKTGEFGAFEPDDRDEIASFTGNTMIVTPERSYLHTDTELTAIDRSRYLKISKERAKLRKELRRIQDRLKKQKKEMTPEEIAQLESEMNELQSRIAKLSHELTTCLLWKKPCHYPYSLVAAGKSILFAGGKKEVAAIDSSTGDILWTSEVAGRALDLAVVDGRVLVSTDKGTIHCFAPLSEGQK